MRFLRRRHSVPALNTTSTADISFMLLIFFLVTTNMDIDKGISRQLPPIDRQEQQETYVSQGTMMTLQITDNDFLLADRNPMEFDRLRQHVERFVTRIGKGHLIKVDVSPLASYDAYFRLQNELMAAYKNIRNNASYRLYRKAYNHLSVDQREKIKAEYPQRIAEVYPSALPTESDALQKGGAQ